MLNNFGIQRRHTYQFKILSNSGEEIISNTSSLNNKATV